MGMREQATGITRDNALAVMPQLVLLCRRCFILSVIYYVIFSFNFCHLFLLGMTPLCSQCR